MTTSRQTRRAVRVRELAHRASGDVEVSLLWRKLDNSVTLRVVEFATGVVFELTVAPESALDAFNHPYVYLAERAIDQWAEALAA